MNPEQTPFTFRTTLRLVGIVLAIVLAIEASVETCIRIVLPILLPEPGPILEGFLDVGLLALLSTLAIWLLVLHPLQGVINQIIATRQQAEEMLSEQTAFSTAWTDLATAHAEAKDLRGMLQRCTEVMVKHLDAAFARIWTLDESENVLELQASAGMYTHINGGHARIPVGMFKIGRIAAERKPHLTNAVVGDPHVGDQEWARREGMVSFAGYPLLVDGRVMGVIALFARKPLSEATIRLMGTAADVIALWVQRRHTEEILQQNEACYQILMESLPVGSSVVDREHNVMKVNQALARIVGKRPADLLGKKCFRVFEGREEVCPHCPATRALATGEPNECETPIVRPDGSSAVVHLRVFPLPPVNGIIPGYIELVEDVTERKRGEEALRVEESLRKAAAVAEAANQAKSEFLANMSHELRTPLHGVIGMTELLLGTNLDERQRRYVSMTKTSGEALIVLINDILDFSKIEAGKLEMEHIDFNPRDVVDNVTTSSAVKAESKGLELAVSVQTDVPYRANGDPKRLQQVLLNLIGNAIKFTQRGEIVVRVSLDHEDDRRAAVRFTITDTGIGIPPERIDRLFQSFSQVDASTTRQYGGSGLGLAISKRLVELMGGHIGVESAPGKGSTFWFTVELEKMAASCVSPGPAQGKQPCVRILAVDDNATNREIIGEHLTALGFENESAVDAEDALVKLREAVANGKPFGMAILDMQMPRMSGEQLAQVIKADPTLKDIVLMLLASALDCTEGDRLRSTGFAGWLMKPVWRSVLSEAILGVLTAACTKPTCQCAEQNADAKAVRSSRNTGFAGAHILLADDNEIGREVTAELLSRAGYRCDAVTDGQQAVEAALGREYDVVLMDCQMPILDGFDATRAIRQHEKEHGLARRLPIIALTANAIKGDRERCLGAGMDDYLVKPLDRDYLIEVLDRYLSTDGPSMNTSARQSPEPTPLKQAASLPPFDIEGTLDRWEMDHDFIARMAGKFVRRASDDLARLEQNLRDQNAEEVAKLAHALKGAAAYVGANPFRELAAQIEENGRNGNLDSVETVLVELRGELQRCVEYVADQAQSREVACENPDR